MSKTSSKKTSWRDKYDQSTPRQQSFQSLSNLEVEPLLTAEELADGENLSERLGFPGEYPFTRGVYPSMYRGRLWTMRQFAGFGSPEETNIRFHYLLKQGIDGLSTAFDMPTLMGYDCDHEMSEGEVGREGVSVSSIEDLEVLFKGIELKDVSTSMTINCTASPVLAMYFALAKRQGASLSEIRGTIQNDILKEYIAQKEWICPPEPAVRIVTDMIEYCSNHAPKFHAVSISGYHIREAGSNAVQELAFTLYDGITYVESCIKRGMDVDSFAPRLSFFFDVHNDFFEEIAKFRAARRMWAKIMKERFSAKREESMRLRTHAQTAGVSLTAQQPVNNVARVAIQALAAVLGGTQSLHTNSMDETLSLPTREAVTVALRTQQIIAEETGVANTIDPLAGSYFVEHLTDRIEEMAYSYIEELDKRGGMLKAIEEGYPQREISDSAALFQRQVEAGEQTIVGLNKYINTGEKVIIPTLKVAQEVEKKQKERLASFKAKRSASEVSSYLEQLRKACDNGENLMPILLDAVKQGVTVGEVSDVYREKFGVYTDAAIL